MRAFRIHCGAGYSLSSARSTAPCSLRRSRGGSHGPGTAAPLADLHSNDIVTLIKRWAKIIAATIALADWYDYRIWSLKARNLNMFIIF